MVIAVSGRRRPSVTASYRERRSRVRGTARSLPAVGAERPGTVARVTSQTTDRALDLTADPVDLTAALVDVPSVSGDETRLADALERALREQAPHLEVLRSGDAVLARTNLGRERRVLLA
ncbi:MAG: succinyl-diaminopimelate desuccinylase, partial [Pseudonocardiales bacterium]|nr:succinyl-diaminopimelate desuccinylase [Pseudonocardiales bacterium]